MTEPRPRAAASRPFARPQSALRAAALAAVLSLPLAPYAAPAYAESQPQPAALASADALKRDAIAALRTGEFDRTQQLIDRALQLRPDDATLNRMDEWVSGFQQQRGEFLAARKKAFDRQVKDVRLLQENGYRSYAINAAALAYGLSADEGAYRSEPWVRDLIRESADLGNEYEAKNQWLDALRVWSDLAGIEPLDANWKDKLKGATRRVRLLAVYTPEVLDELREANAAKNKEVDKLLADSREAEASEAGDEAGEVPATQPADPATKPADPAAGLDESFRTDWHDAVKGSTVTMLRDAIVDADEYYYKPVQYRDLLVGGLDGTLALATTPGLERAFPSLKDAAAKRGFVEKLAGLRDEIAAARPGAIDRGKVDQVLRAVGVNNTQSLNLPTEVIVTEFADGALARLDPFSSMIWPSQLAEFTKGTQGEFVGVGISIRSEDNGDLRVVSPLPDTPAYEAGVQPNDVITHIDGKSAKGITDTQAVKTITGPANTSVTLTIKSVDGTVKDYELPRRKINVVSVKGWKQLPGGKWDYFVDPDQKIAYVQLTNFQKSSSDEMADAIRQLRAEGAKGVIFDLRYNPGGLLQSAVEISDQFLGDGVVVSTHGDRKPDATPPSSHRSRTESSDLTLPMVCLVNEYSASASEIVSGALDDRDRALIVGKRTFGKGSVQMPFWLGRNDAFLKLTIAHYYLPSDRSIHKEEFSTEWGVEPDVPVEMTPAQMREAITCRRALDVLHENGEKPMVTLDPKVGPVDAEAALMKNDAQLSAAVLLMRMQLAGESVM